MCYCKVFMIFLIHIHNYYFTLLPMSLLILKQLGLWLLTHVTKCIRLSNYIDQWDRWPRNKFTQTQWLSIWYMPKTDTRKEIAFQHVKLGKLDTHIQKNKTWITGFLYWDKQVSFTRYLWIWIFQYLLRYTFPLLMC